jgi:hypothetical protein
MARVAGLEAQEPEITLREFEEWRAWQEWKRKNPK